MSDEPELDQPTPEVEKPAGAARVPGSHDYTRMPTGPVRMVTTSGPDADTIGSWEPDAGRTPPEEVDDARLAPWALLAAIVALAASFFVGWGIPVAIVAIIAAVMSLRRPLENRPMAIWALVLGVVATVFSAGWLIWAAFELGILG